LTCPASDLGSKDAQKFLMDVRTRLPMVAQAQLTSLLEQLEAARKSLERTGALAEMLAEAHPVETDLLATIPGVDSLLAVTMLACVGDIERFPTADSLANYAGMVPSVHSSGKKRRHGRITKTGKSDAALGRHPGRAAPEERSWAIPQPLQETQTRRQGRRSGGRLRPKTAGRYLAHAAQR
jgi:transposase